MRSDDPDRSSDLRVAVAGRTNSGKTTLVRTLLRRPVGDIADRANVTTQPQAYTDSELGVAFVDCPGFQDAGVYRAYRSLRGRDPELAMHIAAGADFSWEDAAMEAVRECDLSLYVGSLEAVCTAAHAQELQLLGEEGPVVGLLNKHRLTVRALGKEAAAERIREWAKLFEAAGVPWVEYDAHATPPAALRGVYDLLATVLPSARSARVQAYAGALEERMRSQRAAVAQRFAQEVTELRGTEISISVPRSEYTERRGEAVALEALRKAIQERVTRFAAYCARLYGFDREPDHSAIDVNAEVKQSFESGGVKTAIIYAALGANAGVVGGATLMGTVGTVLGFIAGGPVGAAALGKAGAFIGGLAGGAAGVGGGAAAGLRGDQHAEVRIKIDESVLRSFAGLATTWAAALAYQGFGKGVQVSVESMLQFRGEAATAVSRAPAIALSSASTGAISGWMEGILADLGI